MRNIASQYSAYIQPVEQEPSVAWRGSDPGSSIASEPASSSSRHSGRGDISEDYAQEKEGKIDYGAEQTELDALTNVDPGSCAALHKINASIEAECLQDEASATGSIKSL